MSDAPATDEGLTPETTKPEENAIEVTITTPAKWTIRHYNAYFGARSKYIAQEEKPKTPGGPKEPVMSLLADYAGVLALIDAGVVHVIGMDVPPLSDDSDVTVVSAISAYVSGEVEKVLARPTTLKISSGLSTSPAGTSSR